jgi:hypothetical protein
MYESLKRAVLTALALSAAAWALLVFLGRELVEVPVARAAPSPALVHTVSGTHAGLRQGRHQKHVENVWGGGVRRGRRGGADAR